jgi:hypothetical protein
MSARRIFLGILAFLCLIAWGLWWTADWIKARPVSGARHDDLALVGQMIVLKPVGLGRS